MKELKQKLLNRCMEIQAEVIKQLDQEIADAQKMANDYGQPKDRYDAFRTKMMRQIELYAKQRDKATVVMNTLRMIPTDKCYEEVEFGALVHTTKQKIFVSAGIGKIEVDGEVYYAISPQVPIFNVLRGKKKNESVIFNGSNLTISEIC